MGNTPWTSMTVSRGTILFISKRGEHRKLTDVYFILEVARRYGHSNFPALEKLQKEEMVHGLSAIKGVNKLCDGCLIGKQRRTPFPSRTSYRTDELLELVHGDICGPIKPATPGGKSLFLLLVDDKSRFMWLTLLQTKSEAVEAH